MHTRWGGTEGNELLTIGAAVVLTVLLVVEGITIICCRCACWRRCSC